MDADVPTPGLLGSDDPAPVRLHPGRPGCGLLILCDHAGRATPARLDRLGLADEAFERHIAYDIGAAELSRELARRLGAPLIEQVYSRLVIDCNRSPGRADLIPEVSDAVVIPRNAALTPDDVQARVQAIHAPYHQAIAAEIDQACEAGAPPALILVHSFTPVMGGVARPWQVGVLHQGNALSLAMLALLNAEPGLTVGDNAPYAMDDIDYTAPRHAQARGLQYLELETRQDLIADAAGQARFADLYARLIPEALAVAFQNVWRTHAMNEINIIQPYWYLEMWVFDDPRVGLSAEPFVGGADTMIDQITQDIPGAKRGFLMVFSRNPFPNYQFKLDWRRSEGSGNVYYSADLDAEGWLCPALLRYFEERPLEIYVQVKATSARPARDAAP